MIIFLAVVLTALFSGDGTTKNYQKNNFLTNDVNENEKNKTSLFKKEEYHYDETESFIDIAGNEHIVNEFFYCEYCDDFHDDY